MADLCSQHFWTFFLQLHTQSAVNIDKALHAAKTTFMKHFPNAQLKLFPISQKKLLSRIGNLTPFWPLVTHTTVFDLNDFGVNQTIRFKFIDLIWGWITAARRLPPTDMQWIPRMQKDKQSGERLYGGGVQYGDAFATAYLSCPAGAYPMCISLHWDGTNAHGLESTPIVVGVANVNGQSTDAQTCIAYMPVVSAMGKEFSNTKASTRVKHYIRQKCIGAILEVLERSAHYGVICYLPTINGTERLLTLYPRLMAMNIDQPEAQGYFGLLNRTSCSKCR